MPAKRSRCVVCGKPIPYPYRNTVVHSQACGHLLALRLIAAVPGVIDLLPPKWRADIAVANGKKPRRRLARVGTGPW